MKNSAKTAPHLVAAANLAYWCNRSVCNGFVLFVRSICEGVFRNKHFVPRAFPSFGSGNEFT